jgi:hypothetical protein
MKDPRILSTSLSRAAFSSACVTFLLAGAALATPVVLDDFEAGEGHFASAPNGSGTSAGFTVASSAIVQSTTVSFMGTGSQSITIDDDPAVLAADGTAWRLRNLSGAGTIANNTAITVTPDTYVGYYLMTTTPNLQAGITIDDSSTATERAVFLPIIPDGQWHVYQWQLSDAAMWENFNAGNGAIDGASITIDAIYFNAVNMSFDQNAQFFVDNVSFDVSGPLADAVPEPSISVASLLGGLAFMCRRKRQ